MTQFLEYIIEEIPNSFQYFRVNDVAKWLQFIDSLHLTTITELDWSNVIRFSPSALKNTWLKGLNA